MHKKSKQLLIGLLFLLMCVLVLVLLKLKTPAPKDSNIEQNTILYKSDTATWTTLIIQGKQTLKFERVDDKNWRIAGENLANLDQNNINRLLTNASNLYGQMIQSDVADLAAYGLQKPRATLQVLAEKEVLYQLDLGNEAPSRSGHYVSINGSNTIYLLPFYMADSISDEVSNYYQLSTPEIDWKNLSFIEIDHDGEKITIQQQPVAKYLEPLVMTRPYQNYRIDSHVWSETIRLWTAQPLIKDHLIAHPTNLRDYGLDQPMMTLSFTDAQQNSLKLRIGAATDQSSYYAQMVGEAMVFRIDANLVNPLLTITPLELISKFIQLNMIEQVKEISFVALSQPWQWLGTISPASTTQEKPSFVYNIQGKPVEEKLFKTTYQDLTSLFYEGIATNPVTSMPSYRLSYRFIDNTETIVEFFPYDAEYFAVSIDHKTADFLIGQYQLKQLLNKLQTMVTTLP
jgi:hypothetical protein